MNDVAREVAALAIGAAGPVGSDELGWTRRVSQLSMLIGSMLRDPGPDHQNLATSPVVVARKVLDADVYRGEFVAVSDEEMAKTHRLMVKIRPEHGKPKYLDADGCEWLRTEPRWTPAGFVMQRFLSKLTPSTPVLIYKYVESFTGKDHDTGDDEDKKSRVLAHLEVIGRPKSPQAETRQQVAHPAAAGTSGTGEAGGGSPPAPPPAPSNSAIAARLAALKPAQLIALKNFCVGHGWADWTDPGANTIDGVLVALGKIERGEVLA